MSAESRFSERDIRPEAMFRHYLGLCEADAVALFPPDQREDRPCPGCGCTKSRHSFDKWGFAYATCSQCESLFQSPRPERGLFSSYYHDSPSMRYWGETFLPQVAEARSRHLFAPKAKRISALWTEHSRDIGCIIDVGAGSGLLLDAWKQLQPQCHGIALEPHPGLADICRAKGYEVLEHFVEDVPPLRRLADLAVSFEVLEHAYDPFAFAQAVCTLVKPGGNALFTTLTSSGFDIQVLWDKAKCVIPPQHLNFMSIQGLEKLMLRAGFQSAKVFTPGELDVDIVRNTLCGDFSQTENRFLSTLLRSKQATLQAFQVFLQENQLSSHCWVWATKAA